jgi:flagellar basal-body rod modification protein FlgD
MATTTSATNMFGFTPTAAPSTASQSSSMSGMGKDTFMKLLVAQMQHQNPLEPSDDKEMIAQMTQFSMLEQMTNLATSSAASATAGQVNQAVSLIGHAVTYTDADGGSHSGTVERVGFKNGAPLLTISGTPEIAPSQITDVS